MNAVREMELAAVLRELISLGWTPGSFDQDFDGYEGEDIRPEEKEDCRRIFMLVWEEVEDERAMVEEAFYEMERIKRQLLG